MLLHLGVSFKVEFFISCDYVCGWKVGMRSNRYTLLGNEEVMDVMTRSNDVYKAMFKNSPKENENGCERIMMMKMIMKG